MWIKQKIKDALKIYDIAVIRHSSLEELKKAQKMADAHAVLELLLALPTEHAPQLIKALPMSKAQLRQDLFVLSTLEFKRGGFFVEFGATNGVDLSNTLLLEREFGWNGILAEPGRRWHCDLTKNRGASIETNCVWKESNAVLEFNETDMGELSTIDSFSSSDLHRSRRRQGKKYNVHTISLNEMLFKHGAPHEIDYLSIDTEGSEFEILNAFDFSSHDIRIISCEHNHTPMRDHIFDLLSRKGYRRVFQELSKFDDWYVKG